MTVDDAIKAVDRAFDAAVAHVFDIYVQGLASGEKAEELAARAGRGFAHAVEVHRRMTAVAHDFFHT